MSGVHLSPTTHRQRFENFGALLDLAMGDPAIAATPHVAAVLDLLGEGLMVLARIVIEDQEARAAAVDRASA